MVTNARKIDFIQKIKDMQERTKASKIELLKKIDAKDEEYKTFSSKLKEIQNSNHDILGLMALVDIYYLTKKELAKKDSEVNNFVKKLSSASGYYWRTIRDSGNKSFHSLGIAVDILPVGWNQKNIYWGWRRDLDPDNWMKTPLDRRWMPPKKVVDIFEKYGFIWGGKWVIWDNMHFEYHPELISYREKENNIHFPFMRK